MWIALWRFYTYRRRLERTQRFGSLLFQVCHFVTSLRSHPNFVAFDRPEGNEEMGEMGTSFGGSFCLSNISYIYTSNIFITIRLKFEPEKRTLDELQLAGPQHRLQGRG